jgi:hypothetical protein
MGMASGHTEGKFPNTAYIFGMQFLRKGGMGYFGMVTPGHDYLDHCPDCIFTSNDKALYYITRGMPLGEVALNIYHDYDYFNQDVLQYRDAPGTRIGMNKALFLGDPALVLKAGYSAEWAEPPQPKVKAAG